MTIAAEAPSKHLRSTLQADLFADPPEAPPPPRRNARLESAALAEVLMALEHHPAVAWARRQNTGAIKVGDRFVRFGWRGCSDILGQLKDGRLLAVECKAPAGRLTTEQAAFLDLVRRHGGIAFAARNCRDVREALAEMGTAPPG